MKNLLLILTLFILVSACASREYKNSVYSITNAGGGGEYAKDIAWRGTTNPRKHMAVASYSFGQKAYGTTIFALSEALKLKPGWEKAHFNLALTFSKIGMTEEAKSKFYYLYNKGKGLVIKNRSLKAYLQLERGGDLGDDFFIQAR